MKAIVILRDEDEGYGYGSYIEVDKVILIPDNFDYDFQKLQQEWKEEAWKPKKWRNGLTKKTYPTIPYYQWLHKKYGLEVVDHAEAYSYPHFYF